MRRAHPKSPSLDLEPASARGEDADAFLTELSRSARTELDSILGYTSMLEEEAGEESDALVDDLRRISTAASRLMGMVGALERQVDQERRRRRMAEAMRLLSDSLTSTLDVAQVVARLLDSVLSILPSRRGRVILLDEGLRAAHESADPHLGPSELEERALYVELLAGGRPTLVQDAAAHPRLGRFAAPAGAGSWLGLPIVSRQGMLAVVTLERAEPAGFTREEAELAALFAEQAGVALDNARLYSRVQRLAAVDPLTGALNRRAFLTEAEATRVRCAAQGEGMGVALVDVDWFKQINDGHGHATGDEVLCEVVRRFGGALRDHDLVGRLGGDEFALALPDLPRDRLLAVGDRVCAAIIGSPMMTRAGLVSVTVSIGLASAPADGTTLEALLETADRALYDAKRRGRNCAALPPTPDP